MKEITEVLIVVEGGVADVREVPDGVRVRLIDYDVDGLSEGEVVDVDQGEGRKAPAIVTTYGHEHYSISSNPDVPDRLSRAEALLLRFAEVDDFFRYMSTEEMADLQDEVRAFIDPERAWDADPEEDN